MSTHAPLHASLPPLAGPRAPDDRPGGFDRVPPEDPRDEVTHRRTGQLLLYLGVVLVLVGVSGTLGGQLVDNRDAVVQIVVTGGVALLILGGFWAQAGWIARLTEDNRQSSRQLATAVIVLADVCTRVLATAEGAETLAAMPVTVLGGTTVHRRDCSLLHEHDQVVPVPLAAVTEARACRACKPESLG